MLFIGSVLKQKIVIINFFGSLSHHHSYVLTFTYYDYLMTLPPPLSLIIVHSIGVLKLNPWNYDKYDAFCVCLPVCVPLVNPFRKWIILCQNYFLDTCINPLV